jgi:hypothetical protein
MPAAQMNVWPGRRRLAHMGLMSRRGRRHLGRVLARALTRAPKEIESTPGPAATARRSERRVGFAIASAAERIAVGSART